MYKKITLVMAILCSLYSNGQNIGIGTSNPNASAQLDVNSTSKGLLPPRMTYAQRNAITNPAQGLIVYCTDCGPNGEMQCFNGVQWMSMVVGPATVPIFVPTVITGTITGIADVGASAGGNISSNGGAAVTARGVCWSTSPNPTVDLTTKTIDGTGSGSFTSNINGLSPGTLYHVRAYATNSAGTGYGADSTFTTNPPGLNFPTVTICSQVWSAKNLDVTTYRNGDPLVQVRGLQGFNFLTEGAWCWYNDDSATYAAIYGRLYNSYAIHDPRGLAPAGWHIPSDHEWNVLEKCLDPAADTLTHSGLGTIAANKMRNPQFWQNPDPNANNSSGFSALPGGYTAGSPLNYSTQAGLTGYWWSSTINTSFTGYTLTRYIRDTGAVGVFAKDQGSSLIGISIRVVKD